MNNLREYFLRRLKINFELIGYEEVIISKPLIGGLQNYRSDRCVVRALLVLTSISY